MTPRIIEEPLRTLAHREREDCGCTAGSRLAVEGVSLVTIHVELVDDLLYFRGSLKGRSFAGNTARQLRSLLRIDMSVDLAAVMERQASF